MRDHQQESELATWHAHDGSIRAIEFAPDDQNILSASSDDRTVRLWDVQGRGVSEWASSTRKLAFSQTGDIVASDQGEMRTRVWDTKSSDLETLDIGGFVYSMAISSDGKFLAVGLMNNTLVVFNLPTRKVLRKIFGETLPLGDLSRPQAVELESFLAPIYAVAFTSDGRKLLQAGAEIKVDAWDAQIRVDIRNTISGRLDRTLSGHETSIVSLAVSPDDQWIATGSRDGTVKLWDTSKGSSSHTFRDHGEEVLALAFDPLGQTLASGGINGKLVIREIPDFRVTREIEIDGQIHTLSFQPKGDLLVAGTSSGIVIWDTHSHDWEKTSSCTQDEVLTVAFNPDGDRIVSGGWDGAIRVWDSSTCDLLLTLRGHKGAVKSLIFTPDGTQLVSGSSDKTIRFWGSEKNVEFAHAIDR